MNFQRILFQLNEITRFPSLQLLITENKLSLFYLLFFFPFHQYYSYIIIDLFPLFTIPYLSFDTKERKKSLILQIYLYKVGNLAVAVYCGISADTPKTWTFLLAP